MTTRTALLGLAAAAASALPATAQRIPVGHLMDNSGATSDVGVPYGQGVADTLAWVNASRNGIGGKPLNVLGFDYGYQAPRAVSQYQAWSRDTRRRHPGLGHRRYRGAGPLRHPRPHPLSSPAPIPRR